jgi:hypothetical protein
VQISFSTDREIQCHLIEAYPNANTIAIEIYLDGIESFFEEDEEPQPVSYEWHNGKLSEYAVKL